MSGSSDGGHSWRTFAPLSYPEWKPVGGQIGCSGQAVWVLQTGGAASNQQAYVVVRSPDAGATWKALYDGAYLSVAVFGEQPPQLDGIDSYSGGFQVLGPDSARFAGWCPACAGFGVASITSTDDGGATSVHTKLPDPADSIGSMSFADQSHAWVVVNWPIPHLFRSVDGGKTWQQADPL